MEGRTSFGRTEVYVFGNPTLYTERMNTKQVSFWQPMQSSGSF